MSNAAASRAAGKPTRFWRDRSSRAFRLKDSGTAIFLLQKKGMATDAMPIEETFLLFDQAALGTTFDRGDNKLTTTKLTNATLKL
jgi:hypothetical protein